MSLESMLAQAASGDTVEILPGWGQGRATFGGALAALLYQHAQGVLGRELAQRSLAASALPVRSLTISFVAPAAPGAVQLSSTILRRGKSVMQLESRMLQNGEVVAAMLASFGAARDSNIVVEPASAPALAAPESGQPLPYIEGVVPEFTQNLDFRFVHGGLPFTAQPGSGIAGWVRLNNLSVPCEVAHLLALVDAWPPSVLQMFDGFAPASTLCWTVEFPHHDLAGLTSDWWQYAASADASADGYAHIAAHCWNQRGQLVAICRQTVTVFA